MLEMQQSFSTEMKLRASEKFWNDVRRINKSKARSEQKKFWWSAGIGLIVLCFVELLIKHFIFSDSVAQFGTLEAIVYGTPLLLFVWVLRFFSSAMHSARNRESDAEERMAMVKTFKALEYEDHIPAEERMIVLQALFRPHGLPVEDSVPAPIWDALMKRIDPSSKG